MTLFRPVIFKGLGPYSALGSMDHERCTDDSDKGWNHKRKSADAIVSWEADRCTRLSVSVLLFEIPYAVNPAKAIGMNSVFFIRWG